MSLWHAVAIFAAGIVAGTINTVVGSGTLFTFPSCSASATRRWWPTSPTRSGWCPGSAAGAVGYRRELAGQRDTGAAARRRVGERRRSSGRCCCSACPPRPFKAIVPVFIAIALDPDRRPAPAVGADRGRARSRHANAGPLATAAVFAGGIYGGYFGAAQGILVLAILSLSIADDLQRLNAVKVVLTGLVNLVSGIVFVFAAHVAWAPGRA